MSDILKQALAALEHAQKTIGGFVQRSPGTTFSSTLYGDIAPTMQALRTAIAQSGAADVAQAHGAKVAVYKIGSLRVEDRTAPRCPPTWAVSDGFGSCLSKTGSMDDEPLPSSRSHEWLKEHRWDSHEDAIKAAADYLTENGGAV